MERKLRKPRVAIVGAGNLGMALASSLQRAGYIVDLVPGRKKGTSRRSKVQAPKMGARYQPNSKFSEADVVWVCVPDSYIADVSAAFAKNLKNAKGMVALHSSGALTSDVLEAFRRRGAAVASVHPLMTFVRGSQPPLTGVSFALEGDRVAVGLARTIVGDLGGQAYSIRKQEKAAYHAWGAFASPLLTSLLATSEQVAKLAGVNSRGARRRVIPILLQTLANYASFGAPGAFSGPIVRGDVATLAKHLRVLRGSPLARNAYVALARAALEYLPAKNKAAIRKLLAAQGD